MEDWGGKPAPRDVPPRRSKASAVGTVLWEDLSWRRGSLEDSRPFEELKVLSGTASADVVVKLLVGKALVC